jgi:hypothetical protein
MQHVTEQGARVASWPDTVDEILRGDQAVAFAYVTPARGVVVLPLTNVALSDRDAGQLTPVSSSVGMWKKLRRIQENPCVAVAYHTRMHAFSNRPEYVLLQGRASLTPLAERDWVDRHLANWERFSGPRSVGPIAERWLRAYHWRVGVEVKVERLVTWSDLGCTCGGDVYGQPPPTTTPEPQRSPAKGTGPRIDHVRAAKRARRLPHVLLGWVGADGFPVVVPVTVSGTERKGIILELPPAVLAPAGGRRAGLLAHSFGQHQRKHTGWLEAEAGASRVLYAPHSESGYYLPRSRLLYRIGSGLVTNRGYREGRRVGFLP